MSQIESKLDEFDRRKQELPEWIEFKAKWTDMAPRKNSKAYPEYKSDLARFTSACSKLANEIYRENNQSI